MNPILGIVASSISGSLNASSFESIATVTLVSAQSTISFTSIPSTYKHLQLRGITKWSYSSGSADWSNLVLTLNSDGGANYASHVLRGNGASAVASGTTSQTVGYQQTLVPSSYTGYANIFGAYVIDFLDYANTSKYKTVRGLGGFDGNGSGWIGLASTLWQSTSAINRIDITLDANNHTQYSQFALYGVK